jgi:type 1 glutamine amidotransferase
MRIIITILFALFVISPADAQAPKKLLLLAQGPDGHPPETHEYKLGQQILQKLLAKTPGLQTTVVYADEPWREGPELLAKADGAVLFLSEGAKWLHQDPKRLEAFRDLAKRGGGLTALHWAMGTRDAKNIAGWVELFGGCHGGPDRKYKVLKTDVKVAAPKHPIARGLKDFTARDEFYYTLKFPRLTTGLEPIVQADIDGNLETVCWAWQRPGGGRSFGFSGLHFHENWQAPEYRRLVTQGVLWTMNIDIPPDGIRMTE